jgi:hypothetical protein
MAKVKIQPSVVLELSDKEAKTLAMVLACVGGCPMGSLRTVTEDICEALSESGFRYKDSDNKLLDKEFQSLRFLDNTLDKIP